MQNYTFTGPQFNALCKYALKLKGAVQPYTQDPVGPGLYFVKDEGAYLMPAGVPPDGVKIHDRKYILYFPGFSPNDNRLKLIKEFGVDDFAVYIPLPKGATDCTTFFQLYVGDKRFRFTCC